MSETTMVNLSVLSALSLGERLRVRHGRFFQLYTRRSEARFQFVLPESIVRWWDGSTRHSDFQAILDTYESAHSTLEKLGKETTEDARSTESALVKRMRDSLKGLHTLERTYADDITLVSRIDRLIERVELVCSRYPQAQAQEDNRAPLIQVQESEFSLNINAPAYCGDDDS